MPTSSLAPSRATALLLTIGVLAVAMPLRSARAQLPVASALRATRVDLESRAAQLERIAVRSDASPGTRGIAQRDAERLRERLRDGDFQTGDRVVLVVPNDRALSDTFAIGPDRQLQLGNFGSVPLHGVLRSELDERLTQALARFFREPEVRSTALVRLGVLGSIARPGYYPLSPDLVITDVVMQAGGPQADADLGRTIVRRGSRVLWTQEDLRVAMRQGQTLDQMHLVAGDELVVGARKQTPWGNIFQAVTVVLAVVGLTASLASN